MPAADVAVEAADYQLEPPRAQRFRRSKANDVLTSVLKQKLSGVTYHADNTSTWVREIADEVKARLKEHNWPRYKYVVQVVIGEQRGEAVRQALCLHSESCWVITCLWDKNTDDWAQYTFTNESIFCVAAVYGVYLY
eukprot:jgi/Astpho2/2328/e_gw1.00043.24.1_t